MSRTRTSLAAGAAVLALALAGTVAAQAVDAPTDVKVGYFEVQDEDPSSRLNPAPEAWFSEHDDLVAALRVTDDGLLLASSEELATVPSAAGLNRIVDVPFDPATRIALDGEGSARFSLVLRSDTVKYLRITATDESLTTWSGTGYYPWTGDRVKFSKRMSLADWAREPYLAGKDPVVHQIGVRHRTNEGAGLVRSLTFGDTRYVFTPTAYDDADLEEQLADAEQAAREAQKATSAAKKATTAAQKEAAKQADAALKAKAQVPFTVSGTLKVGKTLTAKGTAVKGVTVRYLWYVGGKKAGTKATLKLTRSHAGKTVKVVVTKTYTTSAGTRATVSTTTWAGKGAVAR